MRRPCRTAVGAPTVVVVDADQVREMNRSMVERVVAMPAEEPAEGGYALRVVQTRGRRSGEPRRTPVAIVRHGGRDHLVSPDLGRDWVRNLGEDPGATILSADEARSVTAVRVDADEGAPVVVAYLAAMTVPWAVSAFPVEPGAPVATVREHMDTIAVFRLDEPATV